MKPVLMGGLMGAMMLWMSHDALVSGTTPLALGLFVGAHVAVVILLGLAGLWVARRGPLPSRLAFLTHRPSARHIALMVGSAVLSAGLTHLIHGGAMT